MSPIHVPVALLVTEHFPSPTRSVPRPKGGDYCDNRDKKDSRDQNDMISQDSQENQEDKEDKDM